MSQKELINYTKKNANKLNKQGVFVQRRMCAICGEPVVFGIAKESAEHEQWMHENGAVVHKNGHQVCTCAWDEDTKILQEFRETPHP